MIFIDETEDDFIIRIPQENKEVFRIVQIILYEYSAAHKVNIGGQKIIKRGTR